MLFPASAEGTEAWSRGKKRKRHLPGGSAAFCKLMLEVYCAERYLLMCSFLRVIEGWSHTSVGPKYWIGPG